MPARQTGCAPVKGYDSMLSRTLVAARSGLVKITTELSTRSAGS